MGRYFALLATLALVACGEPATGEGQVLGDAERGRLLLRQYGCGTCHRIPGVAAADGDVGPPLDRVARRVYLAGALPNSPAGMARFIRAIYPQGAMPNLGVTEGDARDIAADLATLK